MYNSNLDLVPECQASLFKYILNISILMFTRHLKFTKSETASHIPPNFL